MVEELSEFSAGQFETVSQLITSSVSLQMALAVLVVGLIIIVTVYRKFSSWIQTQKFSYTRPHISRFARTAMLAFFAIGLVSSVNAYIQAFELFDEQDITLTDELSPSQTFAKILNTINIDLKNLCNREGALLIFDEVMTGFRVARGGAAELYNVTPDLFTFGKVIGGGLPIGAYGGKEEYMAQIAPSGPVYQAGTLSGNPVAVTAGIETLKLLNDEAYDKLEQSGAYLQNAIQSIINENALPLFQQRVGSMFCLYFHCGPIANTKDVASCDFDGFNRYFHSLLERGVYIAPSQYETGFISLAHSKSILDETIEIISHTLKEFCIPV